MADEVRVRITPALGLLIGVNGFITLLAEKVYLSLEPQSPLRFQLSPLLTAIFTLIVFAILSLFIFQSTDAKDARAAFLGMLSLKLIFSLVTAAFFYAAVYSNNLGLSFATAFYSSPPPAFIHIVLAFIYLQLVSGSPAVTERPEPESRPKSQMPDIPPPKEMLPHPSTVIGLVLAEPESELEPHRPPTITAEDSPETKKDLETEKTSASKDKDIERGT